MSSISESHINNEHRDCELKRVGENLANAYCSLLKKHQGLFTGNVSIKDSRGDYHTLPELHIENMIKQ